MIGNPNSGPGIHTPAEWFNTSAFALPQPYTYGNEKVNPSTSQHVSTNLDMSLFRDFHVGLGEERYFEFRAESFNLFNNVVFGIPNSAPDDTNFGDSNVRSKSRANRTNRAVADGSEVLSTSAAVLTNGITAA